MPEPDAAKVRELYRQERDRAQAAVATPATTLVINGHTPTSSGGASSTGESSTGTLGGGTGVTPEVAAKVASTEVSPAATFDENAIDAYWASYGDAATRATVRTRAAHDEVMEVIIGTDDRTQVGNTNEYPWRAIASLLITAANGSQWIGTGWFVGPRILMTAGHVVYMADQGGWCSQITVIPGRNGADEPFGRVTTSQFKSVSGWSTDGNSDFDYGAIILPADQRLGDTVGWFGWQARSDDDLNGQTVNISGYPGDKPVGTQWFHSNSIKSIASNTFKYDVDTAGGQSGAPVWMFVGTDRTAVGIHTNGDLTGNSATRVTNDVAASINAWRTEVA
jgi:V8-like Glu-specific endopeptidase